MFWRIVVAVLVLWVLGLIFRVGDYDVHLLILGLVIALIIKLIIWIVDGGPHGPHTL